MTVFWLLFAYFFLIDIILGKKKSDGTESHRKSKVILFGLGTWLVLALRSPQCGTDLMGYFPAFENEISGMSLFQALTQKVRSYEQGFVIFNWILTRIAPVGQLLVASSAALTIGLFSYVIHKYSKDILLSFILFICLGLYVICFSALRQAIAFMITFYSFRYIMENKLKQFLITVAIASTFHTSAIVFLSSWLIRNKSFPLKKAFEYLTLYCLIIVPFLSILVSFLIAIIFPGLYNEYQNEGGAITMFIVYALILIASFYLSPHATKTLTRYRWMIFFAVIGQSLGIIGSGGITRIGFYFSIFFSLLIPEAMSGVKRVNRSVLRFVGICLLITFFWLTTRTGYLDVVPYHFVWENGYMLPLAETGEID